MKSEGAVATECFAHYGARNRRGPIGRKSGVRSVNEARKNGAAIQRKARATRKREYRELRSGGAYNHWSKTDGWPAYIKVQPDPGGKHDFAQIDSAGHVKG